MQPGEQWLCDVTSCTAINRRAGYPVAVAAQVCYKTTVRGVQSPRSIMATTKKQANATAKQPVPAAKTAISPAPARSAVTSLSPAQAQMAHFEKAVGLFSQQHFADAATAFRETIKGPAVHVSDRARGYLQVCERRISAPKLEFQTADDHFNYAVERLNARDMEKARQHL
ncbi:MAG TPA: hypothetical protein VNH18_19450, partial [Bryobacteraceae bacterium]|nr:hypothetical protein [Bryobacteraceae bacterium]